MIYGIGIDIIEIDRIKESALKWEEHFMDKIFSEGEIAYCKNKMNPYPHIAGRFAAKEAAIKAFGSISHAIGFRDIEVKKEPSGAPYLVFSDFLKKFLEKNKISSYHLSISHSEKYAVAQVILETEGK
ncbi:holo-ACP synthase [Candidatus Poribacteria bacterium]|nr:holo-ACP synthase [Candidatus Poribacteria bacterium]